MPHTIRMSNMKLILQTVLIIVYSLSVNTKSHEKWTEKTLIKDLLKDYEKRARPVVDGVSPEVEVGNTTVQQITVEFGLGLIQILQLNENEQILTASVRSLYRWSDYHLVWNPEDYENITHINIPTNKIWIPDIALYNYADERLEERRECAATVDHNGTIEWHPMAIYKSTCPVRIKYFPYDKQNCTFRFGPWTFDSARVNISVYDEGFNMKDYVASPEWHLYDHSITRRVRQYACCPETYSDILFIMLIERQPAYYNYILILPCFLLSSLTLVLFWLPPETPAKMVLGMNIFLAFFLLLLLLESSIPSAASSFPLIGNYYCINMTLVTLSTFLCLIVVNLHFRGDRRKEVPFWLRKLAIHHGARLLFVNAEPPKSAPPKSTSKPLKKITAATNAVIASLNNSAAYPSMKYGFNEFSYGNPRILRPNQSSEHFYGDKYYPPDCQCGYNPAIYRDMQMTVPPTDPRIMSQVCPDNAAIYQQRQQQQQRDFPINMKSCTQPARSTGSEDEVDFPPCAFCPACAGLAAAAAAGTTDLNYSSYREQQQQQQPGLMTVDQMIEDPTDELAAVWAAAVSESKTPTRGDVDYRNAHPTNMPARDDESDGEDEEENEDDDDDDDQHSIPDQTLGPDLESFLLQCIRPGSSKIAVNAANAKWNNTALTTQPNSPFYPFTSPICRDESEEEEPEDTNLQYREDERLQSEILNQYNEPNRSGGLQRTNSGSCTSARARKCSVEFDPRLKKRVALLTRDVSDIVKGIRYMQKQNDKKEKVNKLLADWRAVGMVLDRLFFVIYLCALGISILLYFPRSGDDSEEGPKG